MPRTTIDVDTDALAAARDALGTTSPSETVNAALRETARRAALTSFDVLRDVEVDLDAEVLDGWRESGS